MIKVGLTGGIGSGKTLVSKIFVHLGVPVFNADNEAKSIINSDQELIQQLKNAFGDIYIQDQLDRKKLASIIFKNKEALQTINSLVHPKVYARFLEWSAQQVQAKYVVQEAAILFESNVHKVLNLTINVHADEFIRIDRVIERDNTSSEEVKYRMKNQLSDQERMRLADYTIYNNGDRMLLPQVLDIHGKILNTIK